MSIKYPTYFIIMKIQEANILMILSTVFLINAVESYKNKPVTIHYCVETVSYSEHSTALELFPEKFRKIFTFTKDFFLPQK